MARINNGILGGIKGKIGNIEGYLWKGVPVIRMEKRKTNTPPSEKQLMARQRMAVVSNFLKSMTTFVRAGFEVFAENEEFTANNAAKSYLLLHALQGDYPNLNINYSAVKLSRGVLPPAENPAVIPATNGLTFTWAVAPLMNFYNRRSQVMLLVYAPALNKSVYTLSAARRTAGTEFLELPNQFKNQELHTYISFIADDRKAISDSSYVGVFTTS
jgi:hypothetical protein